MSAVANNATALVDYLFFLLIPYRLRSEGTNSKSGRNRMAVQIKSHANPEASVNVIAQPWPRVTIAEI